MRPGTQTGGPWRDGLLGALFGALIGFALGGALLLPHAGEREMRLAAHTLLPPGSASLGVTEVQPPAAGGEKRRPYTVTVAFGSDFRRDQLQMSVEAIAGMQGWQRTETPQSRRLHSPGSVVIGYQLARRRMLAT